MDRLRRLAGIILATVGLLACFPLFKAMAELDRAPAKVIDVLLIPTSDEQVQVSVAYLFMAKGAGRIEQIAWGQGDAFLRPAEDPVMSRTDAEALREEVGQHAMRQVWYRANDPAATAFILAVDQERPWRRYIFGGLAVVVGLVLISLRKS